ncbi:MAG: hypothetical protein D8M59_02690 [Planctomycetes bacterium]|nr:hypothetical protein [Planctomycetota bacterium]NOG52899.1 hypothetical protein [Planctomycetota bacterium]
MSHGSFCLRRLNPLLKVGLLFVLLTFGLGLYASAKHLHGHHENRDGRAGFSMDDLIGAYHGLEKTAPLLRAIENGHPSELEGATALPEAEQQILLNWLHSDRISEGYDNLDLGDQSPAEIIYRSCVSCHAAGASEGDGIGDEIPLEYWDEIKKVSFTTSVEPTGPEILTMSLHTHALGMGSLLAIVLILASGTSLPRGFIGLLGCFAGLGLFADLVSWLFAKESVAFVWLIGGGGAAFVSCTMLMMLMIIVDMWLPAKRDV